MIKKEKTGKRSKESGVKKTLKTNKIGRRCESRRGRFLLRISPVCLLHCSSFIDLQDLGSILLRVYMGDAYWRYNDSRQQQQQQQQRTSPQVNSSLVGKRSRSDYDVSSGNELLNYYPRDDDRGARGIRDTDSINASYDRYLRSTQMSSYGGEQSARSMSGVVSGHHTDEPRIMGVKGMDRGATVKDQILGYEEARRPEVSLPPDATNTLFVEGLPGNCTRREVAHIFRPFVGYKEVRLVRKDARHSGGDQVVLCFVDFLSPAHAATALDALQGYKFDEHDRDSLSLRLQFARHPGSRSGGGHRGKR